MTTRAAELEDACRARGARVTIDRYVDEATAAELLGVAGGTLRNWRAAAAPLPYRRIGGPRGRIWYSLTDLAAYQLNGSA